VLLDECNIEIGGGLGPLKGKVWRIGLMGESSTEANVLLLLSALERILPRAGLERKAIQAGAALAAAAGIYSRP
jgi:alanine-glyoxylate transaminase/serine-glyoxylate transaminase/serine-pyruvate transaminase